jgi:hypothetical protein
MLLLGMKISITIMESIMEYSQKDKDKTST